VRSVRYLSVNTEGHFLRDRRVLVTGGAGLVGSAFVERLLLAGARVRTVQHRRSIPFGGNVEVLKGDLLDHDFCRQAVSGMDCVVHAAGVSGGSKQVTVAPIPMFTDNLLMNTQIIEAARQAGVEYYLFVSNSSVYAKSEAPLSEPRAWGDTSIGIPENETGTVKRAGETQCALYAKCTEMKIAIIRAGNAYGPHDNFDLQSSHVLPALIRKAVERQQPFTLWGSGRTVRDFIHSSDIARGGLFLLQRARTGDCAPVNVATGHPVTIDEAVRLILRLTGCGCPVVQYDTAAPPASPAKRIDVSKMKALGFEPLLTLEAGLRQAIDWYLANRNGQPR
jgi:GDP-L-fucose synthase